MTTDALSADTAQVFANLDAAIENGYPIDTWTAEDIALDLLAFAADFEDDIWTVPKLLPHVEAWLAKRKAA